MSSSSFFRPRPPITSLRPCAAPDRVHGARLEMERRLQPRNDVAEMCLAHALHHAPSARAVTARTSARGSSNDVFQAGHDGGRYGDKSFWSVSEYMLPMICAAILRVSVRAALEGALDDGHDERQRRRVDEVHKLQRNG